MNRPCFVPFLPRCHRRGCFSPGTDIRRQKSKFPDYFSGSIANHLHSDNRQKSLPQAPVARAAAAACAGTRTGWAVPQVEQQMAKPTTSTQCPTGRNKRVKTSTRRATSNRPSALHFDDCCNCDKAATRALYRADPHAGQPKAERSCGSIQLPGAKPITIEKRVGRPDATRANVHFTFLRRHTRHQANQPLGSFKPLDWSILLKPYFVQPRLRNIVSEIRKKGQKRLAVPRTKPLG